MAGHTADLGTSFRSGRAWEGLTKLRASEYNLTTQLSKGSTITNISWILSDQVRITYPLHAWERLLRMSEQ